jgi:hypothetical protein
MSSSTWARVRSGFILLTLMLSLALVPQLMRATPVEAQTATFCGLVSGYVAPTSTTNGSITIGGGAPFVIAANTSFTGPAAASVGNGANLCFALTLNGSLQITGGTVTPNTTSYLNTCGLISGFAAPGAAGGAQGAITIGSQTFTIVSGMTFTGPSAASVANGATLCFQLTLNGANQIVAAYVTPSTPTPTPTGPFQFCGVVTAFTPATASASGTLVMGGQTFTISPGVVGTGMAIVPGQSFCIVFTFSATNVVTAFVVSPLIAIGVSYVCGVFVRFVPAVGVTQSFIIVGGVQFPVATTFSPLAIPVGQVVCFLVSPVGVVFGFLSGIPTAATPLEDTGAAHRVGRLLAT